MSAVALIGASGHGVWHRRAIAAMPGVRLAALCDIRPPVAEDGAPLDGVAVFDDHRAMLAATRPDAVVICTPPHTHLAIARDAVRAGADVLLEKPPVAGLAEHAALAAEVSAHDRICQVNFQALGSAALDRCVELIRSGGLGEVTAVAATGAWWRAPSYWRRSPWAGRRHLDGWDVVDGALLNAFAHAVMQALALAAAAGFGRPDSVEIERYRAGGIEVEDTGCLRLRYPGGRHVTVAVTLAARDYLPGDVVVSGVDGAVELEYPTDRVRLPAARSELASPAARAESVPPGQESVEVPGREGMLANLLAHRADPAVALRCPLERTREFTAVLEAVLGAPPPVPVPRRFLVAHDGGWAIGGVGSAVRAATAAGALLSETGVPWAAARPHRAVLNTAAPPADAHNSRATSRGDDMRKLTLADLGHGGTAPVVSAVAPGGLIERGGFRVYPEPGFRTHDEPGRHVHTTHEIFCIFQGTGSVEIDGAVVDRFQAGDVVVMEPGEDHHLISDGTVPLVFTWMHMHAPEGQ